MDYIDENLLTGETVVYRTCLHWIIFARPFLWLLITVILFFLLQIFPIGFYPFDKILLAIPLALAFFDTISQCIAYATTEFGVTNKRVIIKKGFISRYASENFLQKIETIQVSQSILGRILGYGSIIIHGTGGTPEYFHSIADPLMFRKQVQEQVEKVI